MEAKPWLGAGSAALALALLGQVGLGSPAYTGWPNVNRVKNAGFEYKHESTADGDIPLYWSRQAFSGGSGSFAIETSGVKHGRKALGITDGSSAASWGARTDLIPVEPGAVYTLRSWYRNGAGSGNVMGLRWYDSGQNPLATATASSASAVWTLLSVTDAAPPGAAFAAALLYSSPSATGTGIFDSASLVLADERVDDGGFGDANLGQLPDHWSIWASHPGSIQEARLEGIGWMRSVLYPSTVSPSWGGGNVVLRLRDDSASDSCGVHYTVPVTAGAPYRLSALVKKPSGAGSAEIRLEFYDAGSQQLSSWSATTASVGFTPLSLEREADAGAAFARLVCCSGPASTGECRFDDVSFTEDYTLKYASPDGAGLRDGSSPAHAADYDDASFWTGVVDPAAQTHPVKVLMLEGDYADHLELSGLGNGAHHILLEGETPYAVNWHDGGSSVTEYVVIHDSQNFLFRHLHFTSANAKTMQYILRIGLIGAHWEDTHDIAVQGCSFVHITNMHFGITGAHELSTHGVTWEHCNWVEIGETAPDHMIYNAYGSYDLFIRDNYFQDCGGYYVKFRDENHDAVVEDCTFVSTGTYGLSPYGPNTFFIYCSALNVPMGRDELLPYGLVFRNNSFTYDDPGAPGFESPYIVKMEGFEPSQHPGYYMISTADGQYIADTSNPPERRNARIVGTCHVDFMAGDYDLYGNVYEGCDDSLFRFWRKDPPPGDYWEGICDIDVLLGI